MPAYVASRLATWSRMRAWFPIFTDVDLAGDPHPWLRLVRDGYAALRTRHAAVAATYAEYAQDLRHYCDGETVRQRFRPADLPAPATALPPLTELLGNASAKTPSQRQLAAVVHHEVWLYVAGAAAQLDAEEGAAGAATRRDREATRLVSVSQTGAGSWLQMMPTSAKARIDSDAWL